MLRAVTAQRERRHRRHRRGRRKAQQRVSRAGLQTPPSKPGHRIHRPRAAIRRAIGRSPTETSRVVGSPDRSPNAHTGPSAIIAKIGIVHSLQRAIWQFIRKPFSFCNKICHFRTHAVQQKPAFSRIGGWPRPVLRGATPGGRCKFL
jgi:hypothetical protein